jgi:ankyrin repeat protein
MEDLFACARNGRSEELRAILSSHSAPVDSRDHLGRTPLMRAAAYGHIEALEALLLAGADAHAQVQGNTWTSLLYAACHGQSDACRVLLERSEANEQLRMLLHQDSVGETALHAAARNDHVRVCELLVARGGIALKTKRNQNCKTAADLTSDAQLKQLLRE